MSTIAAIVTIILQFLALTLAAAVVLHVTGAGEISGFTGRLADAFCIRSAELMRSFR